MFVLSSNWLSSIVEGIKVPEVPSIALSRKDFGYWLPLLGTSQKRFYGEASYQLFMD